MLSELISCINSNYEQFKINNTILKINKLFEDITFTTIETNIKNNSFYESLLYILDPKFTYLSDEQKKNKIDDFKNFIVFQYPEYYRTYKNTLVNIKNYAYDELLQDTITKSNINDLTTGFRVYSKDLVRSIDFQNIESNGYSFLVEIIHRINKDNFKITEYPITFIDREIGKSKMSLKIIFESITNLLKIYFSK